MADEYKHPVVLPAAHKVTSMIFEKYHPELLHGVPQILLSAVRLLYWSLLDRVTARSVVSRCVRCTKVQLHFNHPIMAALPRDRVQYIRPFTVTYVDFAGPIYIHGGLRRVVAKKTWIAIFICFSTEVIYLELTDNLSSTSFMATLRCFMALYIDKWPSRGRSDGTAEAADFSPLVFTHRVLSVKYDLLRNKRGS